MQQQQRQQRVLAHSTLLSKTAAAPPIVPGTIVTAYSCLRQQQYQFCQVNNYDLWSQSRYQWWNSISVLLNVMVTMQLLLLWVPSTNCGYCYHSGPPNTSCCCPESPAPTGNIVTLLSLPTPAAAALSLQHKLEILLLSWAIPNISCCCLTPAAAALDPWMWAGFEIYPFWGSCGRPIAIMAILIITVKWIQHPRTSHSKIDIIIRSYWFKMYAVSGIT